MVVVGAGLAGLRCAQVLRQAGLDVVVLEAADAVGGRVRTDVVEGFRLDRGFQVLLTAYPEASRALDLGALDLRTFAPGAMVRTEGRFVRVSDPFRSPARAVETLLAPVGTLGDKWRVARLRLAVMRGSAEGLLAGPDRTTAEELDELGFSERMRERFLRPFYGGIFLEDGLTTTARMFRYTFRMFSEGKAAVPALGMGEIPSQIAAGLPAGAVRPGVRVEAVTGGEVVAEGGERLAADHVVVATDQDAASRLLPGEVEARPWRGTVCVYFDAPVPPMEEPLLLLNGEGGGPVNSLCVPTVLSPELAPRGRTLVSVSLRSGSPADEAVEAQLRDWFGGVVDGWRRLSVVRVPEALPAQEVGMLQPPSRALRTASGVWVAGDHLAQSSIQGALHSGRRVAEAILEAGGKS